MLHFFILVLVLLENSNVNIILLVGNVESGILFCLGNSWRNVIVRSIILLCQFLVEVLR